MNTALLPRRRVVIASFLVATSLLARADNFQMVTVRDLSTAASASGGGLSTAPVISSDGRFVAFASTAQNLAMVSNSASGNLYPSRFNVFVRDRNSGATTLASVNFSGTGGGNGDSFPVGVSTNGQFVVFESEAGDLVANDTNYTTDVFVRDLVSGATTLASVSTAGISGNGASYNPTMTPDGRYVAFVSAVTNLVAGDTNGIVDVFVRDLIGGTTRLVSARAKPRGAAGSAYFSDAPAITPDGRYVAFYSTATNLISGAVSTNGEVYVRDLIASNTVWASTNARTASGWSNAFSCNHAMSADGLYVVFEAFAITNGNVANARAVVLRHDLQTGLTDIVHTNAKVAAAGFENSGNLDLTPDGRYVVFVAKTNTSDTCIYLWDAQTTGLTLVSGSVSNTVTAGSTASWPTVDASGQHVAFVSTANDLTTNILAGGTNEYRLYVRDVAAATTRLAATTIDGQGAVISPIYPPSHLSDDGNVIAFESDESNLATNDINRSPDVFASNLASNAVELVSIRQPALFSQSPDGFSKLGAVCVSTNGRFVAFVSSAQNLSPQDTNGDMDVYVRDLLTGTNILVSADTNGLAGNGPSWEAAISDDGLHVAFTSWATNLVAGDTNKTRDVFVRDLVAGTTVLVSAATNGNSPGKAESYAPVISADGRYVLYRSLANNLTAGSFGSGGVENLFLRDVQTQTNYALTSASSGTNVPLAAMTSDGLRVVFSGVIGATFVRTYVWDTLATARVYTNNATPARVAISPDGQKIALVIGTSMSFGSTNLVVDLVINTNWVVATKIYRLRSSSRPGHWNIYSVTSNNFSSIPANLYVYDFQTGTNVLVTNRWAIYSTNNPSVLPDISPDGRYLANTLGGNVVLYDRLHDATTIVSVNSLGVAANHKSWSPIFSGDGRTLVFSSLASDLLDNDFNENLDVFALQLAPPAWADGDGDGMDDWWELNYFSNTNRDGTLDFDGDGVSDLAEFLAGTDPTDSASALLANIVPPGGPGSGPAITWRTVPRKSYRVLFKDSLTNSTWQELPGNISILNNQGVINDAPPTNSERYYRILLNN